MIVVRYLIQVFMLALLTGCSTPAPDSGPVETATSEIRAIHPDNLKGLRLYRILPQQSTLHILVYRAGALANLGHNHVVSSLSMDGYVWVSDEVSLSGFDLILPVNDLIMDDPDSRLAEGDDFPLNLDEDARAATKRNMLLPTGLDGEHYPLIHLYSTQVTGSHTQPTIQVAITIKDQNRQVQVPVQVSWQETKLRVKGAFTLRQTDFGMAPMSVMAGALRVEDEVTIKFDLAAELEQR